MKWCTCHNIDIFLAPSKAIPSSSCLQGPFLWLPGEILIIFQAKFTGHPSSVVLFSPRKSIPAHLWIPVALCLAFIIALGTLYYTYLYLYWFFYQPVYSNTEPNVSSIEITPSLSTEHSALAYMGTQWVLNELMDKFRSKQISKPTMDTVKVRQNSRDIEICEIPGSFICFKGKELHDWKKQIIPDWLSVLVLLLCLSLTS